MTQADQFVVLGVITAAHGVRGAVKVKPFTEFPESLLDYDLRDTQDKHYKLRLLGDAKGQLICSIEGLSDRNEAEKLKGTKLGVPRSALPALQKNEFYIEDLVGMTVRLASGVHYGTVKAVYNFGAGDIIEIACESGDLTLLPFHEDFVPSVDIHAGYVTINEVEIVAANEA